MQEENTKNEKMILIQITLLYAILIRSQLTEGIVFETRDDINFTEIFL